ncbi:MAG: hypothetical protein LBG14_02620 [Treponema sp.]|jgi:hypothetical protein|nr:hypothetical protein [Treponema sp.]
MIGQQDETTVLSPESSGLTFEKVWVLFQETGKRMKETDRRMKETDRQMKETDKQIKETDRILRLKMQETDRLLRQNQKIMGDLGKKFGTIIEHMFIPNLKEKFNALGYVFEKSSPNVLIGSREHNIYTEIDVFLENGDAALAVEVKTQANIADIRDHIERMGKLRRYFDLHHDRRNLYGAVAAAIIPDNVLDFALKKGFYVIRQSGDNVNIVEPRNKAKSW